MLEIEKKLEGMREEDRFNFLRKLRQSNEETEYADLIRLCIDEVEKGIVINLKGVRAEDGLDRIALLTGGLQALEYLKQVIFTVIEPETEDD